MAAGATGMEMHPASQWDSRGRVLPVSGCTFLGPPLISQLPLGYDVVEICLSQAQEETSNLRLASAIPMPGHHLAVPTCALFRE